MKVKLKKKKSIKKVMVVTLAATIGWAGYPSANMTAGKPCSSSKRVTLVIAAKSIPPEVKRDRAEKDSAEINSGWLLFASAQHNITKRMEITALRTNGLDGLRVDLSLLTRSGGVEIRDVPEDSQYVYVVGNLPAVQGVVVPSVGMSMMTLRQRLTAFAVLPGTTPVTLSGGRIMTAGNDRNIVRLALLPLADLLSTVGSEEMPPDNRDEPGGQKAPLPPDEVKKGVCCDPLCKKFHNLPRSL
jgi:hypothetical protein